MLIWGEKNTDTRVHQKRDSQYRNEKKKLIYLKFRIRLDHSICSSVKITINKVKIMNPEQDWKCLAHRMRANFHHHEFSFSEFGNGELLESQDVGRMWFETRSLRSVSRWQFAQINDGNSREATKFSLDEYYVRQAVLFRIHLKLRSIPACHKREQLEKTVLSYHSMLYTAACLIFLLVLKSYETIYISL